jgi:hypothetical protein
MVYVTRAVEAPEHGMRAEFVTFASKPVYLRRDRATPGASAGFAGDTAYFADQPRYHTVLRQVVGSMSRAAVVLAKSKVT